MNHQCGDSVFKCVGSEFNCYNTVEEKSIYCDECFDKIEDEADVKRNAMLKELLLTVTRHNTDGDDALWSPQNHWTNYTGGVPYV